MKRAAADWATALKLLDEALDRPPADRPAWLESLPPEYRHVLPLLRQLLDDRRAIETGDFLEALPPLPGATAPAGFAIGHCVGPWALLRELGQGGMASVWLAERADGAHKREVALKLPWLGARARVIGERFAREREILSALTHPHIASVLDAGVDGTQPWLALEYVQGQPITAYAQAQGLNTAAKLRLFLQVLQAVQHAHAQLVIHRDLKPSNVMVDEQGQVKLLDFGVAKLLDDDGASRETELTQLGGRAMTPQYASPEQVAGHALGTASDVYSLGVLLYELLTDKLPYTLKRDTPAALEEAILAANVQPPSAAAPDKSTARALRGDLDTIVMKALAPLPAERYVSAESMSQDIERHLQSLPILARPAGTGYRLRKALVRHRVAYGVAAALSVTLATGLTTTLWQTRAAREQAAHAERAKRFVLSIFESADTGSGSGANTTALDLLRQAKAKLESEFRDDFATQVELQTSLAYSLIGFGQDAEAVTMLEDVVNRAAKRLGPGHINTVRARRVLGEGLLGVGRSAEAIPELREAFAQSRQLRDPTLMVESLQWLASCLVSAAAFDEAVATAREATEIAEREVARVDRLARVFAWQGLANVLHSTRRPGQLDAALKAELLANEVYGGRDAVPLVVTRLMVGNAYYNEGRYGEAVETLDAAAVRLKALLGPGHRDNAAALRYLGAAQREYGQPQAALASFRAGLQVIASHESGTATQNRAIAESNIASTLNTLGRHDEAMAAARQSLLSFERSAGLANRNAQQARLALAAALTGLGRLPEAEHELLALRVGIDPNDALVVARLDSQLAVVLALQGRGDAALALAQGASPALRAAGALATARSGLTVGLVHLSAGQAREAIAAVEPSLASLRTMQHVDSPAVAEARWLIGRALLTDQRPEAAEVPLRQARDAWQQLNPQSRMASRTTLDHSLALRALGRTEEPAQARAAAARMAESPSAADRIVAAQWLASVTSNKAR